MARDVLVILTTYNRPTLVRDAIASILGQDCDRWRLCIMDDGCNDESRVAIQAALGDPAWTYVSEPVGGIATTSDDGRVTWWRGPQRDLSARRAHIPYSWTINVALNCLLRDERYVCYLVDDDAFYPESVRARAEFLDQNIDVHVVYGRTRSIQYNAHGGFNTWESAGRPQAGLTFPRPTGPRVHRDSGGPLCYFANNETDPDTGLDYVEEGFWQPGPITYGREGKVDHNQVMHRVRCLTECRAWPIKSDATREYWGENVSYGVGDAAFFGRLGLLHKFEGVDAWVCTKKFHSRSWGNPDTEVRE